MFGFSFVQVTIHDDVDFYWARSRVSEQLTTLSGVLPDGVTPTLGPDATALGQIYYYVLQPPEEMDLAELRSKQDYFIKYSLQSVDGVAEVASIGGYVKQYQIEIDPDKLRYHNIPLSQVIDAVKASNTEVGAKTVETAGMEYIVRGKGFVGSGKTESETVQQIEDTVLLAREGVPVRIRDVAQVQIGPAFRRGALDFNGSEAVGGVVVMRYGENPREVIDRVKAKIASLESELGGIKIHGVYDRTVLINETITTLTDVLRHEILITIVVMVLFLLHVRASIVIAITLPMAVLMSFIAMKVFGVDANIISLAGIAIAIGTMVDMGIIILENIYGGLADWETHGSPRGQQGRLEVIRRSAAEVVPAVITAVSTTVVSFLPVFSLTGRWYRVGCYRPRAPWRRDTTSSASAGSYGGAEDLPSHGPAIGLPRPTGGGQNRQAAGFPMLRRMHFREGEQGTLGDHSHELRQGSGYLSGDAAQVAKEPEVDHRSRTDRLRVLCALYQEDRSGASRLSQESRQSLPSLAPAKQSPTENDSVNGCLRLAIHSLRFLIRCPFFDVDWIRFPRDFQSRLIAERPNSYRRI